MDYRTIQRGGEPFNRPTNLAVAPDGTLYITDGYGNARVHVDAVRAKLNWPDLCQVRPRRNESTEASKCERGRCRSRP